MKPNIMLKAALLAFLIPMNASAVQFFTFYAECSLGLIDTYTGTSTEVGNLGEWSVEAMDYGPDGLLYATVENSCRVHGSADTLATIDPDTLTVNPIGLIGWDDVDALAFSPSGELFAVSIASNELITIDPLTGEGTPVGPLNDLPGSFLGAIDFWPDGTLFGIDMYDAGGGPSNLWIIDPVTAEAGFVGPLGFDSVEGMTVGTGPRRSIIALARSMEPDDPAELIWVNPYTGQGNFIQYMPLPLPHYPGQRDALVALPAYEVLIDIKPGSWPNSINLGRQGVIPVALLSTDDFDATAGGLGGRFGPGRANIVHKEGHIEDVNSDGLLDLLLHFDTADSEIACGDTTAELRSVDEFGRAIVGTDFIRTLACE